MIFVQFRFALYPLIKDDYALLKTAVSFGEGYGPKLIKKKGTSLKKISKLLLVENLLQMHFYLKLLIQMPELLI